jgi:hypothetical protein
MLWLDLVNEAFEWTEPDDARSALRHHFASPDADCQPIWETLIFVREQISAAHFGEPLDIDRINKRLANIRLEYSPGGEDLPALQAQRLAESDVEQFAQTIFLQAMIYLSEFEQLPQDQRLKRCESVYRVDKDLKEMRDEKRWRAEIDELTAVPCEAASELQRCGDFFVSAKARFCSEGCRTRSFQIAKQLKDPNYLAEKQRRYRARKSAR